MINPQKQQELDDNIEFLRGQFSGLNQQIKLPHSLNSEMLRYKLDNLDLIEEKPKKKYAWLKPLIGVAACFVVVFGSVFALRGTEEQLKSAAPMESPDSTENAAPSPMLARSAKLPMAAANDARADGDAVYASDYTQVRDAVFSINGGYDSYNYVPAPAAFSTENDALQEAPAMDVVEERALEKSADFSAKSNPASAAAGFSETNVQEQGVDEADIVKTDGKYLYSYVQKNTTTRCPTIFIADAKKMNVASKIELEDTDINEFYISGDRLITVGYNNNAVPYTVLPQDTIVKSTDDSIYKGIEKLRGQSTDAKAYSSGDRGISYYGNSTVETVIYDISDREHPQKVKSFSQDGDYTSSRVMDGVLYLISNRYVAPSFDNRNSPMTDLVPIVYDSTEGGAKLLPASKIAIAPNSKSSSYAVVSTLDVNSGKADTQAVLGGSGGVYMSAHSLYVYDTLYKDYVENNQSYQDTNIIKFDVDKTKLTLGKTGKVSGYTDGQFAFSEYKGNLRVATTADLTNGKSSNNVYVLNENMQQIGALEGLAPEERIYSVRYLEDMAYVVTFRETDPLFAIDLSNPQSPKLLGQLKIPGFSEYLHPVDAHTLLGIGQSANSSGVTDGLKLSLFDVSDPLNPKELNVYNLGGQGSDSAALYNHKAVMFHPEQKLVGFSAFVYNASGGQPAYYLFRYDREKGFTLEKSIGIGDAAPYTAFSDVTRSLYIGNTLYAFSPEAVTSYDLKTFAQVQTLPLK
ncbi:beta-propeller domain-containing protein [Oscillospiraceae bacterium PP1C4]